MSICIEVEVTAGSHEDAVVDELRALADRLGIMVHASFNGVMMLATPGESRDAVRDRFKRMQWSAETRGRHVG